MELNAAIDSDCAGRGKLPLPSDDEEQVTLIKGVAVANRLSDKSQELCKRRDETGERGFADAKELHVHRYAIFRGLAKVRAQALPAPACQNMNMMARLLEQASWSFSGLFVWIQFPPLTPRRRCDQFRKKVPPSTPQSVFVRAAL